MHVFAQNTDGELRGILFYTILPVFISISAVCFFQRVERTDRPSNFFSPFPVAVMLGALSYPLWVFFFLFFHALSGNVSGQTSIFIPLLKSAIFGLILSPIVTFPVYLPVGLMFLVDRNLAQTDKPRGWNLAILTVTVFSFVAWYLCMTLLGDS